MRRSALLSLLVLSLAAACGSPPGAGSPDAAGPTPDATPGTASERASGTADRQAIAVSLDEQAARDLAARVNAFGFDLLAGLVGGEEAANVVVSPVSVATLLAMVLAGAGGDTAQAIADVLHLDDAEIGSEHAALLFALTGADDVTLRVANSLWIDGPLEAAYLHRVRSVFDATADEVDLGAQETADRIDEWVTSQTEGMIDRIARDLGLPNAMAVLVVLNAVYFQGTWTVEFDPDDTAEGPFATAAGDTVTAPLMRLGADTDERFGYAVIDGAQLVRLPYGDSRRFAMDVLLPAEGDDPADVVRGLDADRWSALTRGLSEQRLEVVLPRLDLAYGATLKDVLTALGMGPAFSPGADFTPMSPADPSLDTVAHKTAVTVDERGTEAAAVTGGVMAVSAPPQFRADRPFVFAVTDTRTGAVLFLGTVTDPTA